MNTKASPDRKLRTAMRDLAAEEEQQRTIWCIYRYAGYRCSVNHFQKWLFASDGFCTNFSAIKKRDQVGSNCKTHRARRVIFENDLPSKLKKILAVGQIYKAIFHPIVPRLKREEKILVKYRQNAHFCLHCTPLRVVKVLRICTQRQPEAQRQLREMPEQIDWQVNQLSQMACISEDLQCWGARDTTCEHKAKDITP